MQNLKVLFYYQKLRFLEQDNKTTKNKRQRWFPKNPLIRYWSQSKPPGQRSHLRFKQFGKENKFREKKIKLSNIYGVFLNKFPNTAATVASIIVVSSSTDKEVENLLQTTLIGRIIGTNPNRNEIRSWVTNNWKKAIDVSFVPRHFFVVAFGTKEEWDKVVESYDWWCGEYLIYLQK
ncbi:hypothetical protein SUGI_0471840 [Cryptomeria japonica]|nr:hypothetical protein SUGI_0471840 [Cryptomeria japonica]